MHILDIIFIAIFTAYLLKGFISGLISASLSILSKAAALFLAIGATPYINIINPFITFWIVLLGFLLLIHVFKIFVLIKSKEKISFIDHLLGGVIGGLDAVFVLGLLVYFILTAPDAKWAIFIENSQIASTFASYIYQARSIIPN